MPAVGCGGVAGARNVYNSTANAHTLAARAAGDATIPHLATARASSNASGGEQRSSACGTCEPCAASATSAACAVAEHGSRSAGRLWWPRQGGRAVHRPASGILARNREENSLSHRSSQTRLRPGVTVPCRPLWLLVGVCEPLRGTRVLSSCSLLMFRSCACMDHVVPVGGYLHVHRQA